MSVRLARVLAVSLMVFGVLGLALVTPRLADRMRGGLQDDQTRWVTMRHAEDVFEHLGRPVTIGAVRVDGERTLRVTWGDDVIERRVKGRSDSRLPELLQHSAWMRALKMVHIQPNQTAPAALDAGTARERLVVVGRELILDPETGERPAHPSMDNYVFFFVLFDEAKGLMESQSMWAELSAGDWRREAALQFKVTGGMGMSPSMRSPDPGLVDDGFSELGWVWPATTASAGACTLGLLVFAGSFVGRDRSADKR